jgi:integrase/recombinase XerC
VSAPTGIPHVVSRVAGRRYLADPLTRDEIDRLLRQCRGKRYPTAVRNRALLVLLWRTGLRIGEAVALHLRDLDRAEGLVRVRRGKGSRPRTVPMDEGAWQVVDAWLARRRALGLGDGPVFCTLREPTGRPMKPRKVRMLLHRLAERAGITRRVHPHAFRHTYAAELYREGAPERAVQGLLGHANLGTTAVYLRAVGVGRELVDVVRSRPDW